MARTATNDQVEEQAPISLFDMSIDFSGVETEYKPRPKGDYPARWEDSEVRVGQSSGEPYLNVTFALTGETSGKVWNSYSLQPQALWRLKGDAAKMGAVLEGPLSIQDIQNELQGRECVLRLDVENYKDKNGEPKQRNKVVSVVAPGTASAAGSGRSF
jgi:hypothetical protein